MADVFGRAIRDWYHGTIEEPLVECDGDERREHPIERFYFTDPDPEAPFRQWWNCHLDGPLVDLGAGAGTDALYWQERHETVAIDASENLVAVMRERGVADARQVDMFALPEHFEAGRFRAATARGTQLGLAGSREGLVAFLADLAMVTTDEATADLLGYRPDPATGLAFRTFHFEYEGDVGETLLFRLFSPDRLRTAAASTPWSVVDVERPPDGTPGYYAAALAKG